MSSFILLFCSSFSYGQNIRIGGGYGRKSLIVKDFSSKKKFVGFNSVALNGEFQKRSFIIGLQTELCFMPISINETNSISYSYGHGEYQGQYTKTIIYETLKYEGKMPSLYSSLNLGYNPNPDKQVSLVFGMGLGWSVALKQKVTKDSLIGVTDHTYSNTPAGQYSHTITYSYRTSEKWNLHINPSNYFITPSFAIRIKCLKEKFVTEIKCGVLVHFRDVYSYSYNNSSSGNSVNAASSVYAQCSIIYTLKKSPAGSKKE